MNNQSDLQSEINRPIWDWSAAALLLIALVAASSRLIITEWTEHLPIIQTITIIAAICGMALGYSQFHNRRIISLGFVYALFFIVWQLGSTLGPGIEWNERLSSLLGRFDTTFQKLFTNQVVTDPLLFLLSMSILFWIIGITAGFTLTRKANPWTMIVPAGITIVILHTYDALVSARIWILAEFLFISLMLVARIHFLKNRRQWRIEKTQVPLYAALNMLPITLGITTVLILAAWGAPALAKAFDPAERAWQNLTEPWNDIREDFSRAFNSLQVSVVGIKDVYGDTLTLGRGSPKSESIILEIEAPIRPSPYIRFYWRSRTYDYYDPLDQGWEITTEEKQEFLPEDKNFNITDYQDRWKSSFNVTVYKPLTVLFTTQETTWVSRPSSLFTNPTSIELQNDVTFIKADSPILAGEVYQYKAQVTNSNIFNLKAAGTDYPEWVLEKYLQLPYNTTLRTRTLAETISAGLETPYEIADAITQYLRDNIEYSETIPPLPEGRDPIDWMLFDLKQGFCNYYATAEVVLLRSLGIPARLAVGYSQGELFYDLEDAEGVFARPDSDQTEGDLEEESLSRERYIVRNIDLHAWPEVFFPGIGWVEFEPTLNQDPLERSEGIPNIFSSANNDEQNNEIDDNQELLEEALEPEEEIIDLEIGQTDEEAANKTRNLISLILVGISIAISLFAILQSNSKSGLISAIPVLIEKSLLRLNITPPQIIRNWSRSAQLSILSKSYMEINKALRRLDYPAGPEATPAERGAALAVLLPRLSEPISQLLDQYQIGEYSIEEGNLQIALIASREIRLLSLKIWYRKLLFHIKYFWKKDREWHIGQYDGGFYNK